MRPARWSWAAPVCVLLCCGAASAQTTCDYVVTPSPIVVPSDGGYVSVAITTRPECHWTAQVAAGSPFFVQYGGGTLGSGSIEVGAWENQGTTTIIGTIEIAGQKITIQQPPPADCTPTFSTTEANFSAAAGSLVVNVGVAPGCRWSARPFAFTSWMTVQPMSGVGPGKFTIYVAENTGGMRITSVLAEATVKAVIVGQRMISVEQAAHSSTCSYSVNPASVSIPTGGGSVQVSVTTTPACDWTVSTNIGAWFTASPSGGTGSGTVTVIGSANPIPIHPRVGILRIGDRTLNVSQIFQSSSCTAAFSPALANIPERGQSGEALLLQTGQCDATYRVLSSPPWVQIYPLQGPGPRANISYTVYPNFRTSPREDSIYLAEGPSIPVSQVGSALTADERFVGHLYFAYLGRYPSREEMAYHISEGLRKGLTRADVVMNFFNAMEFNSGGRFVAGLYVGLLNRDAEFGGWLFQRNALANNVVTHPQIVANFLNSAEFTMKHGVLSNAEFIRLMYRQILLRDAGQAEVEFHLGTLQRGLTRPEMAANFLNGAEFRNGVGPRLTAFLLYSCLLGRAPDEFEQRVGVDSLRVGTPVRALVEQILATPEFLNRIN